MFALNATAANSTAQSNLQTAKDMKANADGALQAAQNQKAQDDATLSGYQSTLSDKQSTLTPLFFNLYSSFFKACHKSLFNTSFLFAPFQSFLIQLSIHSVIPFFTY